MSAHLDNAARALEGIMRELDPEHVWVFERREGHGVDGHGTAATPVALDESGTVTDDAHPVSDGTDDTTATRALDEHSFDEAA